MSERKEWLGQPGLAVVKVGTNVLADARGHLDTHRIQQLADQLQRWMTAGWKIALVSSGAIGAGVGKLNLSKRPTDLPHLQACAAVGQTALMQEYIGAFALHNLIPAQMLLTAADFENRTRYLNARHTMYTLLEYGCVPVINENDTVSVAEIKFGDNDHLAALVANLLRAKLTVLLTNVDGLFDGDPRTDANAERVPVVSAFDDDIHGLAKATKSALGTGGMGSKLKAAQLACSVGSAVIMANGSRDGILDQIRTGDDVGTLFVPKATSATAFKTWLGKVRQPKGILTLDAGAVRALLEKGKSLLAVGVTGVSGSFSRGDVVSVCNAAGLELGRGLVNYNTADAAKMAGKSTEQIEQLLGKVPYVELLHRDNFAAG
jgi:glutamate 5-kinase